MRVLVTGGGGYLGTAVTLDLVAAGHDAVVLTRGGCQRVLGAGLVVGDIRDPQALRGVLGGVVAGGAFDAVVHLAALARARDSFSDPLAYYDVNVAGTLNLLRAIDMARGVTTRVVFASTNSVYGSQRTGALAEDLDVHPESPYAASKMAAEQLLGAYAATGKVGVATLRCFNIAGAVGGIGDVDETRIIPNALRAATGELPHVTLNGDGSAVRDFVHVADVAAAVRLALEAVQPGERRLYNVGSGTGARMRDVVAAAEKVTGLPVPVVEMPPKPEPHTLIADIALIGRELGWVPRRSGLDEILADAWAAWPRASVPAT